MGMIMLDKLDTDFLFLPELEMAIKGCCDDKVCPVQLSGALHICEPQRCGVPRYGDRVEDVSVHKALVILIRRRKLFQEYLFMWQHYKLSVSNG